MNMLSLQVNREKIDRPELFLDHIHREFQDLGQQFRSMGLGVKGENSENSLHILVALWDLSPFDLEELWTIYGRFVDNALDFHSHFERTQYTCHSTRQSPAEGSNFLQLGRGDLLPSEDKLSLLNTELGEWVRLHFKGRVD